MYRWGWSISEGGTEKEEWDLHGISMQVNLYSSLRETIWPNTSTAWQKLRMLLKIYPFTHWRYVYKCITITLTIFIVVHSSHIGTWSHHRPNEVTQCSGEVHQPCGQGSQPEIVSSYWGQGKAEGGVCCHERYTSRGGTFLGLWISVSNTQNTQVLVFIFFHNFTLQWQEPAVDLSQSDKTMEEKLSQPETVWDSRISMFKKIVDRLKAVFIFDHAQTATWSVTIAAPAHTLRNKLRSF